MELCLFQCDELVVGPEMHEKDDLTVDCIDATTPEQFLG